MEKTVSITLTESELNHLINDGIAYLDRMKDKGLDKAEGDMYGYWSRKDLNDKLKQLERAYFPHYDCAG